MKMVTLLVVDCKKCVHCYFEPEILTYSCILLDRIIYTTYLHELYESKNYFEIPTDCPLPDAPELE